MVGIYAQKTQALHGSITLPNPGKRVLRKRRQAWFSRERGFRVSVVFARLRDEPPPPDSLEHSHHNDWWH